ncbi:RagB/SusD family nutrient uptake outer membrane protein [Siphonobacter sp. BAB-5385]|uniref:RagB/SusD family nutrient uptake outer membrane protein n=1 Tax=Siphonobacter sp. BAB-5385 TaxID=1864822 RepID=UPI000B9E29BB|nr:RagB/SusD family nutrient uptake outer membrane protein [Siphonobacter sp. BAB-5385]OZI08928.1 RagB/SusD family nutrient uptake outer membrane protein [Siphonobacter sp. BAB-5385]
MKKIVYSLLIASLMLTGQSCSNMLDEKAISSVGGEYYDTSAGFEAGVRAAYASLRDYYGREIGTNLTVFGTDTFTMGADGSYKYMNRYTTEFNSNVDLLRDLWNNFYVAINTMNILIDKANAGQVSGLTDANKNLRIAELRFLRAHHYFILVQNWGPVALTLTGNLEAKKDFTRAPVKDVYAAITADLEAALTQLPTTTADYGRVTKGACEHLLARVYLTKATSEAAASDDYTKAATYAQNVIKNYTYSLLTDFASVYDQANQVNSEVIFAVQYTNDALTDIGPSSSNTGTIYNGNQTHLFFGNEYDVQAGMKRDLANGRPWKRYMPTNYMLNTVFNPADRTKDSRYKKTFKDTWYSNNPGTFTNVFDNSKTKVTFAAGDTAIFIPGMEWTQAQRAAKPYQVLVPSQYRPTLFPPLKKFFDPLRQDVTAEWGSRDWFVMRLAETYLILAEANLKLGKMQEATDAINVVRVRAAWAGQQEAMKIKASDLTMEFIMEERERELAGEMFRWYDLKRWGVLVERVKKYNPDIVNLQEYHNLRPIPQTQIDRTTGGVTAFPQNTGY